MTLHPEARRLLDQLARSDWSTGDLAHASRMRDRFAAEDRSLSAEPLPIRRVFDMAIQARRHQIPLRIYVPSRQGLAGSLVWLHGGGFVFGSIGSSDVVARAISAAARCVVASVDYRLAPEHPFPAGLEDAHAVLDWLFEHAPDFGAPAGRLAVGGDSAGGCLAAATTLLSRDQGRPAIAGQVLVYPMTCAGFEDWEVDGLDEVRHPNVPWIHWLWKLYLDGHSPLDPLASPLSAPSLDGLPPALVLTAEYDTLRAEGERYATRLRDAGVPVKLRRFDGMIHGFLDYSSVPGLAKIGQEAISEIGRALRQFFSVAESRGS